MNETIAVKNSSHCSSMSAESDLSFSFSVDRQEFIHDLDEMPAFEVRLISPMGRTPSPIENINANESTTDDRCSTPPLPTRTTSHSSQDTLQKRQQLETQLAQDFVALRDLDAQISPPQQSNRNLETIFEDVFLNTPPRTNYHSPNVVQRATAVSELTSMALGKENISPLTAASYKDRLMVRRLTAFTSLEGS